MSRYLYILPLIWALVVLPADANQASPPKIAINLDRQPLIQGEPFTLVIHIETSSRSDPEVRLPRFGGLKILRQSESHPMSFSFSFGFGKNQSSQTKRESNYTFVLLAEKSGRYKLDPVEVVLDGVKYKGEPYVFDVLGSGKSAPTTPQHPSQLQPTEPTSPTGKQQDVPEGVLPAPGSAEIDGAKIDSDFFISE